MVRLRPPGVSAVRANAGADSGGLKRTVRSFGEGGRTGRLSALFPVVSVSVTGSGEGQMSGQYVVDSATRMRCPFANEYPVSISGMRTFNDFPGVRRFTFSAPSRCARLNV